MVVSILEAFVSQIFCLKFKDILHNFHNCGYKTAPTLTATNLAFKLLQKINIAFQVESRTLSCLSVKRILSK